MTSLREALRIPVLVAGLVLAAAAVVPSGCASRSEENLGAGGSSSLGPFTSDAAVGCEDGGCEGGGDMTTYCASNQCPSGFTTCPNSRFPCDVDLRSDHDNCGACGSACPPSSFSEVYTCIEGRCTLQCASGRLDCDGIVDNGCEIAPSTNDNCGACKNRCTDPAKTCVKQTRLGELYGCGCPYGKSYCEWSFDGCVDLATDDMNCKECGVMCPRNDDGDGGAPPANAYFGCRESKCGQMKCEPFYNDCDDDPTNGCEESLLTTKSCGACGKSCAEGQRCALNALRIPECMCAPGQTFCGTCEDGFCDGLCRDLATDPRNCGACDYDCNQSNDLPPRTVPVCNYGSCGRSCVDGWADCNGNLVDGCEVDIHSDPRNCGGCGIACDAIAGQACVLGRCVVEPCDAGIDSGGPTR